MAVELVIAATARRHGVSDEDIRHAYAPSDPRLRTRRRIQMVIGANRAAIVYEIGVVDGVTAPVVVHAMKARDKFLR